MDTLVTYSVTAVESGISDFLRRVKTSEIRSKDDKPTHCGNPTKITLVLSTAAWNDNGVACHAAFIRQQIDTGRRSASLVTSKNPPLEFESTPRFLLRLLFLLYPRPYNFICTQEKAIKQLS
ncbi:hypothetical protein AVEN_12720-1 [Araneus ventricosus]|uniref:Uncharacterized protein n=1 Tax=Araneus ventricosus TaxID=182803 RepID=A0A4Y2ADM3_ARAVE|nr:hypothetical protein AVEN_12720-1 [Araneus ventricosus]